MARKSKQNQELLRSAYSTAVQDLGLDINASVNDQVHIIIEAADALQTDICTEADSIKIEAYATVKSQWPEFGIPKSVWLELVHMRRLQRHTTLTDDYIAKIMQSFEGAKNVTAFRSTLLTALQNDAIDTVQVPTCETEKQLQFEGTETLPAEFIELLNDCADKRNYIDAKLWPKLRMYGDAFCYLTKEPYTTFKHLLDLYHYRNGGWPKATTPPRIWSTIFRFIREYDMLQQYGFDMAKNWCKRMGLDTVRTLPSPTMYIFNDLGERFGKYFMAKLKDDTERNYPQYQFKPWHHIIAAEGKFFAYVWDTRVIDFVGDTVDLRLDDLRTDYQDNCTFLHADDTSIHSLAMQCIPDVMQDDEAQAETEVKTETDKQDDMSEPIVDMKQETVAERKATILASFSPEAQQLIKDNDIFEQYEELHAHPERGFDENYNVRWKPGDRCHSDILGEGYVVGADMDTGELIVYFYRHDKELRCWMWHLTKTIIETEEH